ncbi:hypothetical protein pb186bvf_005826 [Paramecium bursaria]
MMFYCKVYQLWDKIVINLLDIQQNTKQLRIEAKISDINITKIQQCI